MGAQTFGMITVLASTTALNIITVPLYSYQPVLHPGSNEGIYDRNVSH